MGPISKNILIEELIDKYPSSINFLMNTGIKCVVCGEPIWGTLEDAANEKGFSDQELNEIINELNGQIEKAQSGQEKNKGI